MKVSILVFCYNHANTLRRCIDSILNQKTNYKYEIIIADDCSIDQSWSICRNYLEQYDNIRLFKPSHNQGIILQFKDAIALAKGELIMQCAADDWWHNENKIQRQIEFLDRNPSYIMVHSEINHFYVEHNRTIIDFNKVNRIKIYEGQITEKFFGPIMPIWTPTPCYRKNSITSKDFDFFKKKGFKMEDLPMWMVISCKGKIGYIEESLATYQVAKGSLCRPEKITKQIEFVENVLYVQKKMVEVLNLKIPINKMSDNYYKSLSLIYSENGKLIESYKTLKKINDKSIILKIRLINYFIYRISLLLSKYLRVLKGLS